MARTTSITKSGVDALTAENGKPAFLWDANLPGFGVKCSPQGVKRYLIKYRTEGGGRSARQRWLTLGSHGQLTPDQARKMAQQSLAAVARGEDPQGARSKQRQAETVSDLWERFKIGHLPTRKPQTRYEYEAQWETVLKPALGKTKIHQLSRNDVDKLHTSLRATPYRANRSVALLSRLMTLAEVWQLRVPGSNPCRHIERYKERPRNRYLGTEELQKLGETMRAMLATNELSPAAANAIRLLLMTGARLTEILSAKWAWVDYDRCLIALPDSKTGAKPVFLSEAAIAILKEQSSSSGNGEFIFPGPGKNGAMVNLRKPWIKVCERAGLSSVRLHDLRHTAASVAVAQGASLPIIGRLLGHTQAQTTHRYAHVDSDLALIAANAIGEAMKNALSLDNS